MVRAGAVVSEQADIRVDAAIDPARAQTHIKDLRERIDDSGRGSHDATMLEPSSQGVVARERLESLNQHYLAGRPWSAHTHSTRIGCA